MKLKTNKILTYVSTAALMTMSACTEQLQDSFRFAQREETFQALQDINVKVDLLWVVDNSASMDAYQATLRTGFDSFARKYMKPSMDIRMAVIPSDAYLANSTFNGYLNRVVPGSVSYQSPYILSRLGTWQNPSWNTTLLNTTTARFDSGIKFKELVPSWGSNYARLLTGTHDGPITGLCFEGLPAFLNGATQCRIRDDQSHNTGNSHCLAPNTGAGEASLTQCVNTIQNDSVHSGKAILETRPPSGTPGDEAWISALIDRALLNLTTGAVGHGSERHFSSIDQLLTDNEGTSTALFRAGSIRAIIFVTDENDQSMSLPSSPSGTFSPNSDYACDQASLVTLNGASVTTNYCCSNATNCTYGAAGLSCPSKTVDSYTFTPSVCPDSTKLVSVSSFKSRLDTFFNTLDGSASTDSYFVYGIIPTTGASIQSLHSARIAIEQTAGITLSHSVDYPDRIASLVNQVGNGSSVADLGQSNYASVLDSIGTKIIERAGTFQLTRPPTGAEDMIVRIRHSDSSSTTIPSSDFTVSGTTLRITNLNWILGYQVGDQIIINYQPKS